MSVAWKLKKYFRISLFGNIQDWGKFLINVMQLFIDYKLLDQFKGLDDNL